MKVHTIIVPTDFSENAQSAMVYAMWIADNHNAKIKLLHVVLPRTGDLDIPVISAGDTMRSVNTAEEVLDIFVSTSKANLLQLYKPLNPINIEFDVRVGAPASEMIHVINDGSADLVIMGTRGKHNRLDTLFGSMTTAIIQKSKIPVFIIPKDVLNLSIQALGFATDLEAQDAIHIWKASQLVAPFSPIMRVVHVKTKEEKSSLSLAELEQFMEGRSNMIQTTFHELEGENVEDKLKVFTSDYELDLLAFHHQRHSIFERMFSHSVGRTLALFSDVPLLSMP